MSSNRKSSPALGVKGLVVTVAFGALFAVAGLVAWRLMRIDPTWARVEGTVVDVSSEGSSGKKMYKAIVSYVAEGRTYRVVSSASTSWAPDIGGREEVGYDPSRPGTAKVALGGFFGLFPWIFVATGLLCMAGGVGMFRGARKRLAHIRRLVEIGDRIQGVVSDVQFTTGKGSGAYKIVVAATDRSGRVQSYVSDYVFGAAGLAMADFQNQPIALDVYVDRRNPAIYYVDLSDIPKLTPQRVADLLKLATSRGGAPTQS